MGGFRSVTVHHRAINYGLARSIIDGVTRVLAEHESVIVVEDDIVTAPYFLRYMNDALVRFADDERVASIHGYMYPVKAALPEAFFLPGTDCWGWGTWRRGWALFNPDGRDLLQQLKQRNLTGFFDFNGAHAYTQMLADQVAGRNDSWAVRWYASALLAEKLTLFPGHSLVHNIGNDGSGTHSAPGSSLDVQLDAAGPVNIGGVDVVANMECRAAVEEFFRASHRPPARRFRGMLRRLMSRLMR
jgi:hypothetical protein